MTNWAPDATSIWGRHSVHAPAQSQWKGGEMLHFGTLTFRPDPSSVHNLSHFFYLFNHRKDIENSSPPPKIIILSFTQPHVMSNRCAVAFSMKHKCRHFWKMLCIWHITIVYSDRIITLQKGQKSIIKDADSHTIISLLKNEVFKLFDTRPWDIEDPLA